VGTSRSAGALITSHRAAPHHIVDGQRKFPRTLDDDFPKLQRMPFARCERELNRASCPIRNRRGYPGSYGSLNTDHSFPDIRTRHFKEQLVVDLHDQVDPELAARPVGCTEWFAEAAVLWTTRRCCKRHRGHIRPSPPPHNIEWVPFSPGSKLSGCAAFSKPSGGRLGHNADHHSQQDKRAFPFRTRPSLPIDARPSLTHPHTHPGRTAPMKGSLTVSPPLLFAAPVDYCSPPPPSPPPSPRPFPCLSITMSGRGHNVKSM